MGCALAMWPAVFGCSSALPRQQLNPFPWISKARQLGAHTPLCMNSPSSCFKELELSAAPAGVAVVNFSGTRWLYRSGELDEAPRKGSRRSSSNAAASSAASAAASANPGTALAVHFNDSADDRGAAGGGEAGRGHLGAIQIGRRLYQVVYKSERSVYGIAPGRRRSMISTLLPFGILITVFNRSTRPQLVAPLVEAFSDRLR